MELSLHLERGPGATPGLASTLAFLIPDGHWGRPGRHLGREVQLEGRRGQEGLLPCDLWFPLGTSMPS